MKFLRRFSLSFGQVAKRLDANDPFINLLLKVQHQYNSGLGSYFQSNGSNLGLDEVHQRYENGAQDPFTYFRGVSMKGLEDFLDSGKLDTPKAGKSNGYNILEHMEYNNMYCFLSLGNSFEHALNYNRIDALPRDSVVFVTGVPVIQIDSQMVCRLNPDLISKFYAQLSQQNIASDLHDGGDFGDVNKLVYKQREITAINQDRNGEVCARMTQQDIKAVVFSSSPGRLSERLSSQDLKPKHFSVVENPNYQSRAYTICVLETALDASSVTTMTQSAQQLELIPKGMRILTIEDGIAIHAALKARYPEHLPSIDVPLIINSVPQAYDFASQQVVDYAEEQLQHYLMTHSGLNVCL